MFIKFVKNHSQAVTPSKAYPSDTGYDLTIIDVKKKLNNGVVLFDTGISVKPPEGYYTEIVPRSSLSKTGWMLANSLGIIDSSDRGNVLIALIKIDPNASEFQIPFCKFQLILRKLEVAEMLEVSTLEDTERGEGGFGSTG